MNHVLCIVGPTASGKSELAQKVASMLDGEVVSADSMQIYRGMDIGTSKVPVDERIVPHWGIDILDPGEPYSAALFQRYARGLFEDICARGKQPVLTGGTTFYVKAAIDDLQFPEGEQESEFRRDMQKILEQEGQEHLWKLLESRDPESAAAIHPNNSKRVIRALELHEQGKSYASLAKNFKKVRQAVPAVMVGIEFPRDLLYERIDARVDEMYEAGLVNEVEGLIEAGFREGCTAPQAIGYKEIVLALDGVVSVDEALDNVKQATRRYAKRQLSWLRGEPRVNWIQASPDKSVESMAEDAVAVFKEHADFYEGDIDEA